MHLRVVAPTFAAMTDATQPALVLDLEVAQSEPVHFAGFPGLWLADRPIAVSELGLGDADDVYALVAELELPLAPATVAPGEGLMPEVDNHVKAGDVPVFEHAELVDVEAQPAPADPFAEAVAVNADLLVASLANVDETDHLDGLEAAETAGKSRTTVLQALAARRAELADATETSGSEGVAS